MEYAKILSEEVKDMSNENQRTVIPLERIDADAVCEWCGTVNPEGTLLCKTCGNNLRDQRSRRLSGETAAESASRAGEPTAIFGKVVGVVGVLLIIWVALNVTRIEEMMAGAQTSTTSNTRVYWSGPDSAVYNEMIQELQTHPVTPQESEAVLQQPDYDGGYDGRYALFRHEGDTLVPIGQASVRVKGDALIFVAVMSSSDLEFRGEAHFEGNARIASRDTAGVQMNGRFYGVSGFGQKVETGGFECFGLSDAGSDSYGAIAFHVP